MIWHEATNPESTLLFLLIFIFGRSFKNKFRVRKQHNRYAPKS
ncbi:unnamed protein product [Callosobruchus maculatus]|uniref:Uncharacterized protein n=1 Tax=Callosobruchus maculatus TaxID=64391 RepID=A0A653C0R6_CALMS|nr:unnamed protein product [Callosobruchus maculatus]